MQTRTLSAVEAISNTSSGFFISWALTMVILPVFGFDVLIHQALGLTLIYTVTSVLRNYTIRRIFNKLRGIM